MNELLHKMTPEQKEWIDTASHEDLLRKWRNVDLGDPIFQGECGAYFTRIMYDRIQADPAEHDRRHGLRPVQPAAEYEQYS